MALRPSLSASLATTLLLGSLSAVDAVAQCSVPDTTWEVTSKATAPDTMKTVLAPDSSTFFRTDAFLSFRAGLSRHDQAVILAKYCLLPLAEIPGGTLQVRSRDPGSSFRAFERFWNRVRRDPQIASLIPDCVDCFRPVDNSGNTEPH